MPGLDMAVFDMRIFSNTSNSLSGPKACRRADIQLVLPVACLFDETLMTVNVTTGNIYVEKISSATFKEVTLWNSEGEIVANDMYSFKTNFNTSTGDIIARRVTTHTAFLLARSEGMFPNVVTIIGGMPCMPSQLLKLKVQISDFYQAILKPLI